MAKKKCLFVYNGHPHGTVILNMMGTPEREFTLYAEAFYNIAREAVERLRDDPNYGLPGSTIDDFRAYPIVFLYRHALELYMKDVIRIGSPMLEIKGMKGIETKRLLSTHSLDLLRIDLEQVFDAFEWDWDLGTLHFKKLDDFRKIIAELHEVDGGSDAFRYPVKKNGDPSLKPNFSFNLFKFCELLDELLSVFEGAASMAHEELQFQYEIIHESGMYEF